MSRQKVTDSKMTCPVLRQCGGCQYMGMDYERYLDKKQESIEQLLKRFGPVRRMVGMEEPYFYRNKVCAEFMRTKAGDIVPGKYQKGSHRVVPVQMCRIENQQADAITQTMAQLFRSFKLTIYNEDSGYGLIRHVLIRTAHRTGQVMVIIVTATPMFPSRKNFIKALLTKHPEITTIIQNINDKRTSMVLGVRNQVLYGKGYIEDVLCKKRFRLSPGSFYQVNSVQTERLYRLAVDAAHLTGKEIVIDAYCGIGTIGMIASEQAKVVYGVELNPDAIRDAKKNCFANQISNIRFYTMDAGRFMVDLANHGQKADVVFLDPPRSGSTTEFLSSLIKLAPRTVVYISCGPESLARDLDYLIKHGYKVKTMTPVDMFPFTEETEVVASLSLD